MELNTQKKEKNEKKKGGTYIRLTTLVMYK